MAWSTPRTWVAGEVLTAAYMNQEVRDNLTILRDPPAVHVRRDANQTGIVSATWTAISFDVAVRNTWGMWSAVTNPTRMTVPVDGTYLVGGGCEWPANATGGRGVRISRNGSSTDVLSLCFITNNTATHVWRFSGNRLVRLLANDYVEIQVDQVSGANMTMNGGEPCEGYCIWTAPYS